MPHPKGEAGLSEMEHWLGHVICLGIHLVQGTNQDLFFLSNKRLEVSS